MLSATAHPAGTATIGVLTATGEPLFGDAVERVVRQYARFQFLGHAPDAHAILEQLRALRPDIAVLGPSLPGLDGCRLLRLVRREEITTRLVFVDDHFNDGTAYDLLSEGAAGVLAKTVSPEQLRNAILTAAAGREFLSDESLAAVTREIRLRNDDDRPRLSDREHEILQRIAEGQSSTVMATAMHLGLSTIKTHCRHVFEKLGVSDRGSAVAEGMRRGLID